MVLPCAPNSAVIAELPEEGSCDVDIEPWTPKVRGSVVMEPCPPLLALEREIDGDKPHDGAGEHGPHLLRSNKFPKFNPGRVVFGTPHPLFNTIC